MAQLSFSCIHLRIAALATKCHCYRILFYVLCASTGRKQQKFSIVFFLQRSMVHWLAYGRRPLQMDKIADEQKKTLMEKEVDAVCFI
jgi:hypothetical protein